MDKIKGSKKLVKEHAKGLNILLKAYLYLGISSMLITDDTATEKNSRFSSSRGRGKRSMPSSGKSRQKEFKDVFIKGYNLSKKYFGDSALTKKFQLYTFEAMK